MLPTCENNAERAFDIFHDLLTCFYELCFPLIPIKITCKPLKNKWLTKGIKRSCSNKRQLYLNYQQSATNKDETRIKYNRYKIMLT